MDTIYMEPNPTLNYMGTNYHSFNFSSYWETLQLDEICRVCGQYGRKYAGYVGNVEGNMPGMWAMWKAP